MPHNPATRALTIGSVVIVLLITVLGLVTLIALGTSERARRNTLIIREICVAMNRQSQAERRLWGEIFKVSDQTPREEPYEEEQRRKQQVEQIKRVLEREFADQDCSRVMTPPPEERPR